MQYTSLYVPEHYRLLIHKLSVALYRMQRKSPNISSPVSSCASFAALWSAVINIKTAATLDISSRFPWAIYSNPRHTKISMSELSMSHL